MRILVTGGTGHLGREVVRLITAEHRVRVLSRVLQPPSLDYEWAVANLATGQRIREAVEGIDAVFHLASNPKDANAVDVVGTRHLVEAAHAAGVAHFVYISIVGIDDIPLSYYKHKRIAEQIVESSSVPHTILRATQFYSLVDSMLSGFSRLPLIMPLPADLKFQAVAEYEVAQQLVNCLWEGPRGRIPDYGGPEILSLHEMGRTWMEARNQQKMVIKLPSIGNVAKAFREGKNTTSSGMKGLTRWSQWLAQSCTGSELRSYAATCSAE